MEKVILLIDDDANLLRTLRDILENAGYKVVALNDPLKAEQYIEKYMPDLLVIDVFMPGRSGFNLVEDFKNQHIYEDIPKMFITCLDDDIERMTARACGVERYITKPFSPELVLDSIKNMIGEAG
ncbi:MAG: response regulator [Candidatus Omnitrophota bacterium]